MMTAIRSVLAVFVLVYLMTPVAALAQEQQPPPSGPGSDPGVVGSDGNLHTFYVLPLSVPTRGQPRIDYFTLQLPGDLSAWMEHWHPSSEQDGTLTVVRIDVLQRIGRVVAVPVFAIVITEKRPEDTWEDLLPGKIQEYFDDNPIGDVGLPGGGGRGEGLDDSAFPDTNIDGLFGGSGGVFYQECWSSTARDPDGNQIGETTTVCFISRIG